MNVENASSIQKVDSDDSIVACQPDATDFFDSIGPQLPLPKQDQGAQQPDFAVALSDCMAKSMI